MGSAGRPNSSVSPHRYRHHVFDLEIDHEMLRVSSRPFTAPPMTIAYP
jgi:hypothetical protein